MADIALITGATRGLGATAARRLADQGFTVLLGARDLERGRAVAAEIGGDVHAVAVDVTSDTSVADAVATVGREHGRLDVLVNNAGIVGPHVSVEDTGPDELREVYETNVLGPVRATRAFLPLLREAANPRVVMVSSGLGSFALTADPERIESTVVALTYLSSKSALNMITTQYAKALPELRINAVDPGYTATDLNGHSGHQTVEEGTDAIVAAATIGPDGPTGTYFDRQDRCPGEPMGARGRRRLRRSRVRVRVPALFVIEAGSDAAHAVMDAFTRPAGGGTPAGQRCAAGTR